MTIENMGTALITGASAGIGTTFARKLAAMGYDLLLTARREDRLKALASELEIRHGVKATTICADLAVSKDVGALANQIRSLGSLTMLVNNAGFGTAGLFADSDIARQLDMINVHVTASVQLTHAALPGMISRKRGDIINVSSISGFLPSSGSVTYASTKAYLNCFSEALHAELRDTGVRIQALCPGFTYTEFHDSPELEGFTRDQVPKALWMSSEAVVEKSLGDIRKNKVISIPGLKNRVLVALLQNEITSKIIRRKINRA